MADRFQEDRDATEAGGAAPEPLATDLRAGTELAGYHVEGLIGRGGMGVVYRAEHRHLGRRVALKLLGPELAGNEDFRERFVRESRAMAELQHPNIVAVYDAGEAEGLLYIAMQLIEGSDLARLLRDEGALEPERAIALMSQVAGALDAAHGHGIVHRDVKPANVLLEDDRAYLVDFGLTKRLAGGTALTAHGSFVGTIDYVAPEQIEGKELDARADVYALGCMLFHCLTGQVPYDKESEISVIYAHMQEPPPSPSERKPGLPGGLDAVIAQAMAKEAGQRHESCAALIEDAERVLAAAQPAWLPSKWGPDPPPSQRPGERRRLE